MRNPDALRRCLVILPALLLVAAPASVQASPASSLLTSSAFLSASPSQKSVQFHNRLRSLRGGAAAAKSSTTQQASPLTPSSSSSSPITSLLAYNESTTDAGSLSIPDLFDQLSIPLNSGDSSSSTLTGLTPEEAQQRLQQYGRNVLDAPPSKSVWQLIWEQFEDRLVQILLAVALLSGIFSVLELRNSAALSEESLWKSFVEPLVILAILVLNAAVGVWQSQSASDSLEALQKMQPTLATVLRKGSTSSDGGDSTDNNNDNNNNNSQSTSVIMDAAELVPGDILELRVGDKIPADARLLSLKSSSLKVDEGSLTGESVTVGKLPGEEGKVASNSPVQDQKGMLYSGTMVTSGSGVAVVVQTGMDTQFGKVCKNCCRLCSVLFVVYSIIVYSIVAVIIQPLTCATMLFPLFVDSKRRHTSQR